MTTGGVGGVQNGAGGVSGNETGGAGSTNGTSGAGAGSGAGPLGCKKVDFLFVIDNSASMGMFQDALINSFGPFMDTIFSTVKAQDYNIMVVDSDGLPDDAIDGACEPCEPDSFWCGDWCSAKSQLDQDCQSALGAGTVAPYNKDASNRICGVPAGQRFLTSSQGQTEIKDMFACIAKLGIFGSGAELPMSAMVQAVTTQAAAGACNEGFLRDDAVLVVTIISDDYPVPMTDDDASSVGTVNDWYEALVDAKLGKPENVVMLGILNTANASCVSGAGDPIVHPTQKFIELVEMFGARGLTGNICDADFNGFFGQAVELIDSACRTFQPLL